MAAFEELHGVRLPEEYRAFLRLAGSSGAGPYYGLVPLNRWPIPHDCLRTPCPMQGEGKLPADWLNRLAITSREEAYRGTMAIAHQGCTYFCGLVVTGAARGRVFYFDEDGEPPYFVENRDFLSWYERWLDELLADYDDFWFGFGMGGTESELLDCIHDAQAPTDRRAQALYALQRLPRVGVATTSAVVAALLDPDAEVRTAAAYFAGKFKIPGTSALLKENLNHADPAVRRAAIYSIAAFPEPGWQNEVRRLLADPDVNVVETAIYRLKDAGALSEEHLAPVILRPEAKLRRLAVWALPEANLLANVQRIEALGDSDAAVRHEAIHAVGSARLLGAVPTLNRMLETESDPLLLGSVALALGELRDWRAVGPLIVATGHPDALVREKAARALGTIGDPAALPALEALLSDNAQPESKDERGFVVMRTQHGVGDEARKAIARINSWRGLLTRFARFFSQARRE